MSTAPAPAPAPAPVDPNKAIDPRSLAPSQPEVVVQKLHETVVGKLGKTMGYAKHDVQEALSRDEPSAIKDAYLIVRENQMMKENRTLPCPLFNQCPSTRHPLHILVARLMTAAQGNNHPHRPFRANSVHLCTSS